MTTTTPLVRVDTTVNTDVKYSKVFALAFVKNEGVTGVFTEDQIRAFVIPKLSDATLFGSAIVQLDSLATGHNYHSGKGDESFTNLLTKVFVLDPVALDLTTNVTTTIQGADFADAGIDVYFMTMDGINETAVNSLIWAQPPFFESSSDDPKYYELPGTWVDENVFAPNTTDSAYTVFELYIPDTGVEFSGRNELIFYGNWSMSNSSRSIKLTTDWKIFHHGNPNDFLSSRTVPFNQWVTVFVDGQAHVEKIIIDGISGTGYGGKYATPFSSTVSDPFRVLEGIRNVKIRNILLLNGNPDQSTITKDNFRFSNFDESHPYYPKALAFFKGGSLTDSITGATLEVKY